MDNLPIIIVLVIIIVLCMTKKQKPSAPGSWTCTNDKGDKVSFGPTEISTVKDGMDNKSSTRTSGGNIQGYDQVVSPEYYSTREGVKSRMTGDTWDPDSRDQVAAYHDVVPPAWSADSLMYYGAVDAQVIQNHKEFTSSNWMFNQNAAFADFGDNPNYPYPVTSIRLNAINNVPTDTNPHQITEDQDDGGASRRTFTDKQICYGTRG
jgi:hypothetical protein